MSELKMNQLQDICDEYTTTSRALDAEFNHKLDTILGYSPNTTLSGFLTEALKSRLPAGLVLEFLPEDVNESDWVYEQFEKDVGARPKIPEPDEESPEYDAWTKETSRRMQRIMTARCLGDVHEPGLTLKMITAIKGAVGTFGAELRTFSEPVIKVTVMSSPMIHMKREAFLLEAFAWASFYHHLGPKEATGE